MVLAPVPSGDLFGLPETRSVNPLIVAMIPKDYRGLAIERLSARATARISPARLFSQK